jgi:serine/threonine protein phosphatase PrpC
MMVLAQKSKCIRAKPSPGRAAPWTIGCASISGSVRPKNEDYALAFEIAGCQIVLVADGVSGEPLAGPAAYLAIQSAAWSVIRQVGAARPWRRLDPAVVASRALWTAAKGLSRIAAGCGCATGLKTTLIVVVAAPRAYGYAYIGDGKGCILRATGMEEDFLIPQRAQTDATCVLAACLGPTMLGSPITGTIPRQPGDLLIVGTDGAFSESVELSGDFIKQLLRAAFHFEGDLQRTVNQVLQELSSTKDQLGFLFDDNLSLALAGDGKPPRLSPGFWPASGLPKRQQERGGKGPCEVKPLLPAAASASAREPDQP